MDSLLVTLIQATQRAAYDYKINEPLTKNGNRNFTVKDLADTIDIIKPYVTAISIIIQKRPGIITAAVDVCEALEARGGNPWATDLKNIVIAAPGMLRYADEMLPIASAFLSDFEPVPAPLPGMGPRVGRG